MKSKVLSSKELRKNPDDYSFITSTYDYKNSVAFLWVRRDGVKYMVSEKFVPYVYEKHPEGDLRDPKTLEPVMKVTFSSCTEYLDMVEAMDNKYLEDGHRGFPEMQWSQEFWLGIPPWERNVEPPVIMFFDIEVEVTGGSFPDPREALYPICMISYWRSDRPDQINVLGLKDISSKKDWFTYKKFDSEKELLLFFFKEISGVDVISGWNSERFDIPYIGSRVEQLDLLEKFKRVFDVPRLVWFREGRSKSIFPGQEEREILKLEAPGVVHLDYLKMVKKLTYGKNYPSFKLGTVGMMELGIGKVDIEVDGVNSLNVLYEKDFDRFVEYSAQDTLILVGLENKFKLFSLLKTLGTLSLARLDHCLETPSRVIEGTLFYYYRKNKYALPRRVRGGKISYPGAFVKEPIKKVAEDIIYFDLASSYPSHQIVLGISPEVYLGRIEIPDFDAKDVSLERNCYTYLNSAKEVTIIKEDGSRVPMSVEELNELRRKNIISISPEGGIWDRSRVGILPQMLSDGFRERKRVKKEMYEADKKGDKNAYESKYILQWGIKTLLNSTYGICGSSGSRISHTPTATAVTTSGKYTILVGEKKLNEFFNNPDNYKDLIEKYGGKVEPLYDILWNKDFIVTIDTDSLIGSVEDIMRKAFPDLKGWSKERKEILEGLGNLGISFVTDYYENTLKRDFYSSDSKHPIKLDFEVIAQKGLFYARKKYVLRVRVKDGIEKDELKKTGVDFIKSDTPILVKEKLEEIVNFLFSDDFSRDGLQEKVSSIYNELLEAPIEDISRPTSTGACAKVIPEIRKMSPAEREAARLGLPIQCKAILNTNYLARLAQKEGLDVPEIRDDELKIFYFLVKKNPFRIDVVCFSENQLSFPKELFRYIEPDREAQLERVFVKKVEILTEPLGWKPIFGKYIDLF